MSFFNLFSYLCVLICVMFRELGALPPYIPYYYLYQGPDGQTLHHFRDDNLSLQCLNHKPILEAIPFLNASVSVIGISVYNCVPPVHSYVEVFNALNITTANLTSIHINFKESEPIPPGNYTNGLQITNFVITKQEGSYRDIFREAKDFLEPLVNVTFMGITDIQIPKIPDLMKLKKLTIYGEASLDEWGNCRFLEELHFLSLSAERIPIWPAYCKKLKKLEFEQTPERIEQYLSNLTAVAANLVSLKVSSSFLYRLPHDLLKNAVKLEYLDLSENNIYDHAFVDFPVMKSVKEFDLSQNLFGGPGLKYLISKLPALRVFKIMHSNSIYRYCDSPGYRAGLDYLFALPIEDLSFFDSEIDLSCFAKARFSNLTSLNLGGLTNPEIYWRDLPTSGAPTFTIDFYFKDFIEIFFNETDYKIYEERHTTNLKTARRSNKLIVKIRYVKCDCANGWLARALRDFPDQLEIPNLRCDVDDGIGILKQDPKKIECDKWGRDYCFYRRRWGQTDVDAECDKGFLLNKNYTVRGFNVSGHDLAAFYTDIPESVTWLDYRNNRLSTATAQDVETLFVNGRRVWLGNNQIICDCENRLLLDAILERRDQVLDFDTLTCIGTGQKISEVDTYVLCQTSLKTTLIALGILAFIAMAVAFTIRRYNEEIRMFLFARGWFLVCLRKEEMDDKPFDVFISYAHGDETYVRETLIPGLENAAEQYRVCVHYRDWVVGDWIPAQIMRSVKLSKRTIIVLSKSFIESTWSALEFRYAIANANQDNKSRVLILVLDDVLSEELDPELQGYLSYNTYLSCDDPWFWEKLRYALPHKNKKKFEEKNTKNSFDQIHVDNSINNIIVKFSEHNTPLNNVVISESV